MAVKVSTGLRNKMLDTSPLRTVLNLGFIKIYGGTVPTTADDALGSATLLTTISNNDTATGLTFEATAAGGIIEKASGETWSGTNAATGTATFYRFVTASDDGTSSTTQERIQGTIDVVGADLNLSSTSLTSGALQTIDYYVVTLPTAS